MPQDYLMRLIEQTRLMLSTIIVQRQAGRNDDATREIEAACLRTIGLPFSLVQSSSPEALSELMQRGGEHYFRAVLLAELLLQDAELNKQAARSVNTIRSQLQAFCLLAESIDVLSPDDEIVYRPKLDSLAQELGTISDAPYLQEKLRNYALKKSSRSYERI